VSYKAHRGRGSEFAGCVEDTRVNVLDDLERWADDNRAPNVCWLGGMAGVGKSSVAVTFSELMDKKLKLGASSCRDARLIVPTIVHMLG
jgi:2-phosphoglycerate kinase